ncbi:MAG: sugar phosphate isomerase/epimerase [Oscillospiraceae bacterium]|jgi:sugar phosphate isomerase/epimerase|nr:sugar phosphate isomerase/epimerase [Oscillospiraceae bacterium]
MKLSPNASPNLQKETPFRFGAQLYSVRERCQTPEGFRQTVKEIAAIGYKGVQVSGQSRDIDPRVIRDACDSNGLSIVCTHVPFDDLKDQLDKIIQNHQIYSCRYPGLGSLPMQYYENGVASLMDFISIINGIADKLADHDMRLLYHNHAHEFQRFNGRLAFDLLREQCNENVQFEIDTFWVQCGGGDPVKALRGRSADVIHFKDMLGTAKNGNIICTVGKGNLDWPEIIQTCRETRVQWAMVEQDNAAELGDSIRAMADAFDFLVKQGVEP